MLKRATFIYIALVFAIIYSFFWISLGAYYSYPTPEDLQVSFISKDIGVIKGAFNMLNTYDGRYTTDILHGLNPLAFGWYYGHKIMPILTMFLLIISLFFFLNSYFINKDKIGNGIFSIVLTITFFSVLSLSTTLYWMISSFVYLYSIIFFLLFYSFYLNYIKEEKLYQLLLSQFFLFLTIGCNELFLIITGVFLAFELLIHFNNSKYRTIIISFLIIYLASSLLFVSSPGIHKRMLINQNDGNSIFSDSLVLFYGFSFSVFKSIYSVSFFSILFIFIGRYQPKFNHPKLTATILFLTFILIELTLISLIGVLGFPARTLASIIPILILIIFIFFTKWSHLFKKYEILLVLVFLISFFLETNSINKIKNEYFSGKLDTYKNVMDENYQALIKESNLKCMSVVQLKDISNILPASVATTPIIAPNRNQYFYNNGYEKYFGVDEVRLKNDTIPLIINKFNEITY